LDYPLFNDELTIVKNTTSTIEVDLKPVISGKEIMFYQNLIRKIPINDNVLEYAVKLAVKTRPNTKHAAEISNQYLKWGAGPRASQYLVLGAKTHAALHGKYSPDIEDVKVIAPSILRHRIIKNYKAEAEGISVDNIIEKLL
jgi:MoxR-like ATPase